MVRPPAIKVHVELGSTNVQSDEQPSFGSTLLSSHASVPIYFPSPQVIEHSSFAGDVSVHAHPVSIVQVVLHPSPSALFPSSHASPYCLPL